MKEDSTKTKIEEFHQKVEKLRRGCGEAKIAAPHSQGKLTARERLEALFDAGSFEECKTFVTHRCTTFGMDKKYIPSDGVICGSGLVDGRLTFAFSQDFTCSGGSVGEMHAKKIVSTMLDALKCGAPIVGFNDSGGARIQEGVDALSGYGKIFYTNTLLSGVVPQISVIAGNCAGGAAYSPAMTDFIIMVENTARMFIAGPSVIKAVTGEDISTEALGGAETHARVSGNVHFTASSDLEAVKIVKRILSFLPSNNVLDPPATVESNYDVAEDLFLNEIIPDDPRQPYNMKDIVFRLSDGGEFLEVQKDFAPNLITGFARLGGIVTGIIANQPMHLAGAIDINSSDKGARFIRFCNVFNIPLLNLVDVPGFLPGIEQEHGGIIRHGAKLLFSYSSATVPKITVITRKAYGGAYLAMCSKDLGADRVYAWPTAEIAVMGAEGAASILFKREIKHSSRPAETLKEKIHEYREKFANPYVAASRGYIDNVIEPKDTRRLLILALNALRGKRESRPPKKHGNIPL